MKTVLALDLATVTGWALRRADGRVESGREDFGLRKGESSGARWRNCKALLQRLFDAHAFEAVHFEDCVILSGPGQTQTARVYGGFVAVVEMFCEHRRIPYTLHRIGAWKKRFTGNGAARKDDVIAVCRQLGFKPVDSNEADALGILHVALDACPTLTPSPPPKAARRPAKRAAAVSATADGNPF
jgi:Holliday junction resolvasome RuvABC endonuclease subunit